MLLAFLHRLLCSAKGKVFWIVDGHPVHHGKMEQRWLAAQGDRIAVFYLPGYSPELNPDELLNRTSSRTLAASVPKTILT